MTVQTVVTVFNARVGADRREIFFPTVIDGASYQPVKAMERSGRGQTEALRYRLRIPINAVVQDGKTYVSEQAFKAMSDEEARKHWTLRTGDFVMPCAYQGTEPAGEAELSAYALRKLTDLIHIKEYADNTIRGSDEVKHWRIGGA